MNQDADPRTPQFGETLTFVGVLLTVHFLAFVVARFSMDLVSRGYLAFVCLLLPITAVAASIVLRSVRRWHWGQITFVVLVALLASFLQFLIIGSASAAV